MEATRDEQPDHGVLRGDSESRGIVPEPDLTHQRPPLLSRGFDQAQVTSVRHAVTRLAAGSGLAGRRLEDFALAVNELVTNAVRHAGGQGRLRLWQVAGRLCCEVTDDGPGIAAALAGPHPAPG